MGLCSLALIPWGRCTSEPSPPANSSSSSDSSSHPPLPSPSSSSASPSCPTMAGDDSCSTPWHFLLPRQKVRKKKEFCPTFFFCIDFEPFVIRIRIFCTQYSLYVSLFFLLLFLVSFFSLFRPSSSFVFFLSFFVSHFLCWRYDRMKDRVTTGRTDSKTTGTAQGRAQKHVAITGSRAESGRGTTRNRTVRDNEPEKKGRGWAQQALYIFPSEYNSYRSTFLFDLLIAWNPPLSVACSLSLSR